MNLLGAILYDPSSAATKACTANIAMTAFDTTNLRLTVTVPAHGMVRVKMSCAIEGAATYPQILLGVMVGSTVTGRISPQMVINGTALATTRAVAVAEFTIAGLTPGSTVFDAAYGVEFLVAASNIRYGGPNNTTASDAWGGFSFEIWDPRPLTLALDGAVNVKQWNGTNVATPATAGVPDINVKNMNNVAATSITTVNANQGTTQPVNFTGTGASALVKGDTVDWNGTAVSTPATAGIPEVNVKNINNVSASPVTTVKAVQGLTTADTIATYTGNTPQTGDSFLVVKSGGTGDNAAIKAKTDNLPASPASTTNITAAAGCAVSSIGANVITATSINADAITAAKIADGAIDAATLATDTITAAKIAAAALNGKGDWNIGKTGYTLSAAGVQAIWDALTSALTTVGSIGKKLADWVIGTSQTGDSFARLGAPAGASVSADIAAVQSDTDNIQTRIPAALVSGRMDSSVGAMAANVITATAINADAITDAKVASDVTIASVTGAVGSVTAAVTVGTNNDKTGYALSAGGIQAIWDALTSALTTAGSIGKWIVDKLDVVLSTRLATSGYTAPLDAAGTRTAVGLASANLDTQLDALPTNAELTTALGTADDAVLTQLALVKAKTDQLTFTVAGEVDANIQSVNDTTVTGDGQTGTEWGS